ncbi:MAG: ImmA/IrrE family metallo-endopeptidase [Burkholderiales bacterium]|nr:ImmA/IrrE family metallo-endopeptidase [Burkholderiales bacterium]
MTPGGRAEARIAELGITSASELDVEAIAYDAGMQVKYAQLDGCDATLVGFGDKAIATIRRSDVRGRERFSIAHELGHWEMHRGRSFQCRVDEPDRNFPSAEKGREREADVYAAHLLMPANLFNPAITGFTTLGFEQINEVRQQFDTSLLATALRLVNVNARPIVFACYTKEKLVWSLRARDVPRRWQLCKRLDEDSFAIDVVQSGKLHPVPGKQPAEVWFSNDEADDHEITECCVAGRNGEVWVLLTLNSDMMEETDNSFSYRDSR